MTRHAACPWLIAFAAIFAVPGVARAQTANALRASDLRAESADDGVYDRFDGDLDLALALGAEFGSAGGGAPAGRVSAHYFSIAGVYLEGRMQAGDESARSLFGAGVDLRPLFVARWAKGFETGPALLDLTLDSLSLSLGAFWSERARPEANSERGFEAALGFGVPLFLRAAGPWLEARGVLRYPDGEPRDEAVIVALAWHGFLTTPLSKKP